MAGLEHYRLAKDPAIIKLGNMIQNRYRYFRWTKRTAFISFMYVIVVPGCVGYLGWKYDGQWDMRAKRRGDMLSDR
ncbi:hypothetical protein C8A05DRAFT_18602 [Staphylotrichum tortipilum]|uniref:NADH dehydrogenase [ubiquinone] 1 beta subcomplex subunit 4 n=1 Tax=Staphylotrichum tortipilum TaxID=2831512 RepID=A0AAN6MER2_9PEZI|nr:hypothetical protein C8A05DRAFT_18602 [Staphylotrichum longicolle]